MKFSPHITAVQPPPITEVKSWLAEHSLSADKPLIDLCQAVPDYAPPAELIAHLKPLLDLPETSRYSPDEGLHEVRQAVSDWYGRRYGAAPTADEVCLTIGASQAFWLAMMTLCQSGDEVIVQSPAYFDHPMALQSLGVRCIWAPFREETHGLPDVEAIAALITPRTRAILLVNPSNPTGAVTPPEMLRQLFELARQHNIALVLDETYNAFLPAGQPLHDLFACPDWRDHFISLASFGKTFALTGYRAGALIAGPEVIRQALKIQDSMAVCQPRITQQAVRYGCEHLDDWVAANALTMESRHNRFSEQFTQADNPFTIVASGGFFAWVKHPWNDLSSREAAKRLLLEQNILSLPGAAFGPGLDSYLRLAFGNLPDAAIPQAIKALLATDRH
jgi:aspartate/methionine/tyrosine aminotransferase